MWRKVILSILFVCAQSVGCSTLMTLWDSLYFSFVYRNKKTRFSLEIEFIIFKWQFWIFEWLSPSLRQHIKYTNTHINIFVRKSNEFFLHFSLPLFVASPSLTAKYIICVMCVCVLAEYVWKMHDFHALLLNVRVCERFLCEWTGCACVTLIGSILLCRVSNTKTCISFSFTIRSPNVKLYSFVCMYTVTNLIWN